MIKLKKQRVEDKNKDENDNLQSQNKNGLNLKIGELINLVVEKSNLINETNENELRTELNMGKKILILKNYYKMINNFNNICNINNILFILSLGFVQFV